ncbi:hypothetical protein BSAE_1913 [Bifidobacterium pullorum subsp. saeculare DSM 6531 = LMG 14934]|uniref:Uncharacterized protein n=1 Tax=Bifidobacterium pullorum subsp. saeculare DSM 6531 = LMG 14934 TaxID=1437611 RepID=A0A087CP74_9BIFI|nr:hypothetical protein BSAE_1913 [Bifidobacterium pullorum subsp. saeculare DSM 6531 = LMG 14934]
MREVAEVAEKDPGAGLRRLSNRGRTLLCVSMLLYIVKGFGVLGWLVRGW